MSPVRLHALRALLAAQHGVVSRRQVLGAGGNDAFIQRMLRGREWRALHPGVYVDHTGVPSWPQRCWAAVLFYWPAALWGPSALSAYGARTIGARPVPGRLHVVGRTPGPGAPDEVHVSVDHARRVAALEGVRVHRVRGLSALVQPNLSPPRIRLEHALLDCAAAQRSDDGAVAVLADACQVRRTTPERLLRALEERPRMARRRFLREVLLDAATGVCSVLERRYLRGVERPHGLPTGTRQRRVRPGRTATYRDVEYLGLGVVLELDGRLGHDAALDRWRDLDRDLDSMTQGDITARLGWVQVAAPCRTAARIGRLLQLRGWTGTVTSCGPGCTASALWGDLQAPGA